MQAISKTQKALGTLLTLGAVIALGALVTFSAFSSSTESPGNEFDAGTVYISDNDSGSFMYDVTNQKPGVTTTKCIRVAYEGSLDANVRLYTDSTVTAFAQYVSLRIVPVTFVGTPPAFPSCVGSTEDGAALFDGKLGGAAGFATLKNSYANGIADFPGALTKWTGGADEFVYYKFEVSLDDDNAANAGAEAGYETGTHKFIWEARNQ